MQFIQDKIKSRLCVPLGWPSEDCRLNPTVLWTQQKHSKMTIHVCKFSKFTDDARLDNTLSHPPIQAPCRKRRIQVYEIKQLGRVALQVNVLMGTSHHYIKLTHSDTGKFFSSCSNFKHNYLHLDALRSLKSIADVKPCTSTGEPRQPKLCRGIKSLGRNQAVSILSFDFWLKPEA